MQKGYQTKSKQNILNFFQEHANQTATVSDLCQYLEDVNIPTNKSTIYRCLDRLLEQGQITKYVSDDGKKAIYQYIGSNQNCQHHLHLKCTNCGRIIHLDCHFMDEIKNHILESHQFYLQCDSTIIYGQCKDCKEQCNTDID